jgi:SAM-dependent methyltransferase
MQQILRMLPAGSKVLDLGSGSGSFDATGFPLIVVRADIAAAGKGVGNLVVCSAARLPFGDRSFRAVILNHSLEHFTELVASVSEIARVLDRGGLLYIAVPDASTFTDRVYRWLGRGGGHVNRFTDRTAVPRMITRATGLKHAGTRVLCTSLSFLNRRNLRSKPPRKLLLFGNGNETVIRGLTWLLRAFDRVFHRRACVYGWAYYFGDALAPDTATWSNVCVRCGSADPSGLLRSSGKVTRRRFLPATYTCPACGGRNFFTDDEDFAYLGQNVTI